ncbi:MAG: hypothetical protein KF754_07540 [Planctomycetes bacterium]|nr:hypothetical protein [Planctomycetota bacterium]
MRPLLALLLTAAALPLAADFKCTVSGNVQAPDGKPGGVTVKLEADNMWGRSAESFEKFKQDNGPLPKITLEATATTDKFGAFSIECDVKVGPEGKLPVQRVRQGRGGPEVESTYVFVTIKPVKTGYRGDSRSIHLTAGGTVNAGVLVLADVASISGSVMRLSDRKPQADLQLKLRFTPRPGQTNDLTVTTDSAGKFSVEGDSVPLGQMSLTVDSAEWAFAATSVAWRGFNIRAGANDLGNLIVVPGGAVKGRVINVDTKAPIDCMATLRSTEPGAQVTQQLAVKDGNIETKGLPEGAYEVQIGIKLYWQMGKIPVKVSGGKTADLGDIALEPYRSLEVLAFADNGAGIEKYVVALTYAGGKLPLQYEGGGLRPGVGNFKRQELTAEKCVLDGLWSASWTLTVHVAGYSPRTMEVEIPKDTSVRVTLEQGGTIRVTVQDENGNFMKGRQVFAVRHDSPSYKSAKSGELRVDNWGELPVGVFRSGDNRRGDDSASVIESVASGTYMVWAFSNGFDRVTNQPVRLVQDNVKVEKGQTAEIILKPVAGKLTVNVTESGTAKAGVKVYLVQMDWDGAKLLQEASSDTKGKAVFADLKPTAAAVLTKREYDWVKGLGREAAMFNRGRLQTMFKDRNVMIGWGDDREVALELNDGASIWVTLEVKITGGAKPDRGSVLAVDGDDNRPWERLNIQVSFTDGKADLGPLPKGKYRFVGNASINGEGIGLDREFVVNTAPEQVVKMDFTFESLTISVKLPKNVASHFVNVMLSPASDANEPRNMRDDWRFRQRAGRPDDKGTVTFINVPAGEWVVTGHASPNGTLTYAATEKVTVKGDTKVTLKFNENVGTINVRISGNPALGPNSMPYARAKVFLLNNRDQPIDVGDANFLYGSSAQPWTIPAVPAGNWTAVVAAHGLQTVTQKIKVEKDKPTALNVSPLPAAVVQFILTGEDGTARGIESFNLTYEDAEGKPVAMYAPDKHWISGTLDNNGKLQVVGLNVGAKVKKVRVTIEGYEDVLLDLTFEAGKTFLSEQTLKKKPK